MQIYIATTRHRQQLRQVMPQKQRAQGLAVTHMAAQILREKFDVSRVVLFRCVLSETNFHETSNLDLAVWDLPASVYFQAVARLTEVPEFKIDLVNAEAASPHLQAGIEQGVEL
jgi:predicted nucleotidyltransferase